MKNIEFSTFAEIQEKLKSKELSLDQVVDTFLDRFKKYDESLGSAIEVYSKESILKSINTENIDYKSPVAGIPGVIKNNICQENRRTTCASKILENYVAPYDATVVKKLKSAGALCIASGNLDEFAMGSSTETSAFKKTKNPWDISRVPGGSSGGSIAAVAAGLAPWALGSDTGGSVRYPASLCNLVGLKPTYGRVSRYGLIAYGSSLDCVGHVTKTVTDNAKLLSIIAGQDAHDSTTLAAPVPDYLSYLTGKLPENFTLGIVDNAINAEGFDPEVKNLLNQAIEQFKALGAKIKHITLPSLDESAATYFIVSRAEAASNLARFDGVKYGLRVPGDSLQDMYLNTKSTGFGKEVQRRILIGNYALSAGHADEYYNKATEVRKYMRQELLDAFKDVNLLFMPASPAPAFKFGQFEDNKLQMDLLDYFTAAANLTGIPAIAVPCGFTSMNLPVGFQLFGPDLSEPELFQAAYAYEQVNSWYKRNPSNYL